MSFNQQRRRQVTTVQVGHKSPAVMHHSLNRQLHQPTNNILVIQTMPIC